MRIGTNIGIMSSIMDAALESLNYKYTWAASFHDATGGSLANATDKNGFGSIFGFAGVLTYAIDGLKISYDGGGAVQNKTFTIKQNRFPLNQTSTGGGASGNIPAGLIPNLAGDATTPHAEFIGHPSRYFSIVVTVTDMNLTGNALSPASYRGVPFGFDFLAPGDPDEGTSGGRLRNIATFGGYFSHINGVVNGGICDSTTALTQSAIDDRIATGSVIAFTYDLSESDSDAAPREDPSDDITDIAIYPLNYNAVDLIEFTMHGFIFSDVPPIIKSLPVETQTATPNY